MDNLSSGNQFQLPPNLPVYLKDKLSRVSNEKELITTLDCLSSGSLIDFAEKCIENNSFYNSNKQLTEKIIKKIGGLSEKDLDTSQAVQISNLFKNALKLEIQVKPEPSQPSFKDAFDKVIEDAFAAYGGFFPPESRKANPLLPTTIFTYLETLLYEASNEGELYQLLEPEPTQTLIDFLLVSLHDQNYVVNHSQLIEKIIDKLKSFDPGKLGREQTEVIDHLAQSYTELVKSIKQDGLVPSRDSNISAVPEKTTETKLPSNSSPSDAVRQASLATEPFKVATESPKGDSKLLPSVNFDYLEELLSKVANEDQLFQILDEQPAAQTLIDFLTAAFHDQNYIANHSQLIEKIINKINNFPVNLESYQREEVSRMEEIYRQIKSQNLS